MRKCDQKQVNFNLVYSKNEMDKLKSLAMFASMVFFNYDTRVTDFSQYCFILFILSYFIDFTDNSCFVRDTAFSSHDLTSKKLPNPEECQKWCQETKKCDMFVYATKEFNTKSQQSVCYLKNAMADRLQVKKGLVTGPKFCPIYGESILLLNSIKVL